MSPDDGGFAAAEALALQPDGMILATGIDGGHEWSEMAIARYAPNGSLDQTFGVAGAVHLLDAALSENDATAVRIQRDGRIVLGGSFTARFALVRLMTDGSVDRGFGADGPGRTFTPLGHGAGANALAVQRDGKFVLAGGSQNGKHRVFALARYDRRGRLDRPFGAVTTSFSRGEDLAEGVALQRNGKIVAAGIADESRPSGGRSPSPVTSARRAAPLAPTSRPFRLAP